MAQPTRTRSQYFAAASAPGPRPQPPTAPSNVRASSSRPKRRQGRGQPKVKIEYDPEPEPTSQSFPDPSGHGELTAVKKEPPSSNNTQDDGALPSAPQPKPAKRNARKPAKAAPAAIHQPPTNWSETYKRIDQWRATGPVAPVDTAGCTSLAQGDPQSPAYRFHTLVALMLSSQTKDEITAAAMRNLHALDLTVDNVLAWPDDTISTAIGKVGFWRRKTEYIKKTARILKDKYDGDIPKTIEELMALPGVGPKMGYLALQVAWGINDGIGVDVHVHRISNRLGWTKTNTPEETRKALESWLPRDLWPGINPMLVGFGQVQCLPVRPMCGACPIADVCPSNELKLPKQQLQPGQKRKSGASASASSASRKRQKTRHLDTSSEEEVDDDQGETSESETDSMMRDASESELSSVGGESDSD